MAADIAWHIWVGVIVTIVPATLLVAARFLAQTHGPSAPGLGADDWLVLASLVVNWAMAGIRFYQVCNLSYGQHASGLPDSTVSEFQITFLAVQEVYFLNAVLTKCALLSLYHRIFGVSRKFTIAIYLVGVLVVSYFIVCVVLSVVGCQPVSYFWDKHQPGRCFDEVNFFRANGITNMLLDITVLVLPLPMVWRLDLGLRQKLAVTGMFLLGSFVCVTSVLRILAFKSSNQLDPTYTTIDTAMWSSIEQSLGIVCACLPTLRPLFRMALHGDRQSSSARRSLAVRDSVVIKSVKRGPGSVATAPSEQYMLSSVPENTGSRDSLREEVEEGGGGDSPRPGSFAETGKFSHPGTIQHSTRIWSGDA